MGLFHSGSRSVEETTYYVRPTGISAGLHVVTWLPADLDEPSVVAPAAERGLGVYGLRPYRLGNPGPAGLLFGYGNLGEPTIVAGVELLAETIAGLRGAQASGTRGA